MNITLLPSGAFELSLNNGTVVSGKFSAGTLKKFSLLNGGLGFNETIELLTNNASIGSFLKFILCAVEGDYTEFDVLEWVQEMGGFNSDDFQKLMGHFMDGFISKKKLTEVVSNGTN